MSRRTDAPQNYIRLKGCYARQWMNNVGMHTYAKCDENLPSGSEVMSYFSIC